MASFIACGSCEVRSKSTPANYWCHECDDLLCEECNNHHSAAKLSRGHIVISVDNYRKLPESVRKVSSLCPDHDLKYVYFCKSHNALCCPKCAQSTHKSCNDLQLLDEVTRTAKTSSLIDEVERSLKEIKSNLEKIISERDRNVSELRKQKQEIKERITSVRKQVNKHINALEERIQNELSRLEENEVKELQKSKSDLTSSIDMVKNKLEETTMLKQYASDLQTFLGTRELETLVEKEKTSLEKSFKDGSLNIRELQFGINDKIQAIVSDITTYGSVSVISKPSPTCLIYDKDKQAQIFLSTPQPNGIKFKDATVNLKSKFNIQGSQLRGCSAFPDDKFVIADGGKSRVIIVTKSGTTEKEIPTRGGFGPYDVTVIDDRSIAVSTGSGVQIIDVKSGTFEKMFDIGSCGGLSYHDGMLYCFVDNKGIISIEMSTGRSETIIQDRHDMWSYIAVVGGHLYYTRADKNGLQCYSNTCTGEKKWEHNDTTLIDGPHGVTTDSSGNVYLASYLNNKILMISPDGQRCRPILSDNDGIVDPWGVCFNKNKNELFVICLNDQCFHYKID